MIKQRSAVCRIGNEIVFAFEQRAKLRFQIRIELALGGRFWFRDLKSHFLCHRMSWDNLRFGFAA